MGRAHPRDPSVKCLESTRPRSGFPKELLRAPGLDAHHHRLLPFAVRPAALHRAHVIGASAGLQSPGRGAGSRLCHLLVSAGESVGRRPRHRQRSYRGHQGHLRNQLFHLDSAPQRVWIRRPVWCGEHHDRRRCLPSATGCGTKNPRSPDCRQQRPFFGHRHEPRLNMQLIGSASRPDHRRVSTGRPNATWSFGRLMSRGTDVQRTK